VEHNFTSEIVLVDHSDGRPRSSYQYQYHFKLVYYLIGANKPRNFVDPGSMRLAAAHSTQGPMYNAAVQAFIAQQQ
jgi:hypothetical protein